MFYLQSGYIKIDACLLNLCHVFLTSNITLFSSFESYKDVPNTWIMQKTNIKALNRSSHYVRRSRSQMLSKIGVLNNLEYLLENTCVGVSFDKVSVLKVWNFIKKRLQHSRVPVKFLRTFFYRTPPVAASDYLNVVIVIIIFLIKSLQQI